MFDEIMSMPIAIQLYSYSCTAVQIHDSVTELAVASGSLYEHEYHMQTYSLHGLYDSCTAVCHRWARSLAPKIRFRGLRSTARAHRKSYRPKRSKGARAR